MIDDDYAAVRRTASDSVAGKVCRWTLAVGGSAVSHSAAHRWMSRVSATYRSWPVAVRVRQSAVAIAVAGAINLLILATVNDYAAPGIPRALVAMVAALAAVVAMVPESFVRAWPHSFLGRRLAPARARTQNSDE